MWPSAIIVFLAAANAFSAPVDNEDRSSSNGTKSVTTSALVENHRQTAIMEEMKDSSFEISRGSSSESTQTRPRRSSGLLISGRFAAWEDVSENEPQGLPWADVDDAEMDDTDIGDEEFYDEIQETRGETAGTFDNPRTVDSHLTSRKCRSRRGIRRGQCREAVRRALKKLTSLRQRPTPTQIPRKCSTKGDVITMVEKPAEEWKINFLRDDILKRVDRPYLLYLIDNQCDKKQPSDRSGQIKAVFVEFGDVDHASLVRLPVVLSYPTVILNTSNFPLKSRIKKESKLELYWSSPSQKDELICFFDLAPFMLGASQ